ncbi:hypothetical protein EXE59_15945 [Nocardioides eburneiflavus]|uniref:Secreted protein n=1 Tax=Nocardioides eburneiflavus TaxID=2518372 RepID=A0A4Z1C4Q9_9ACTN|nr:hypothetical protein [Nocardioides eburneiflavus]TGN65284.1 hypothetical protein EXE59_15945 [Nocardioides eburneiflavus]
MQLALAVLMAVALVPTAPPSAMPEAPRHVTRHEYAQVSPGMTRTRVERTFGAGRGCVYVEYELDDVLHTGRQYRDTAGTTVSIQYEKPDGGRSRAIGKQWGLLESCFHSRARAASHTGSVVP